MSGYSPVASAARRESSAIRQVTPLRKIMVGFSNNLHTFTRYLTHSYDYSHYQHCRPGARLPLLREACREGFPPQFRAQDPRLHQD